MRSMRIVLALACILLVVLSGTVQVAHSHAGNDDGHASCSLCATAHVTVHLSEAVAPVPSARVVARIEVREPVEVSSNSSAFPYFSRPPPALNSPA